MNYRDLVYNPKDQAHRTALAIELTRVLRDAGFAHEKNTATEEIWTRKVHKDPRVKLKVYTSITSEPWKNPNNGETIMVRRVRSKGLDAIRVCAVITFDNGHTKGYAKSKRTNRTGSFGSISTRMLEKMRDVYGFCLKRIKDGY